VSVDRIDRVVPLCLLDWFSNLRFLHPFGEIPMVCHGKWAEEESLPARLIETDPSDERNPTSPRTMLPDPEACSSSSERSLHEPSGTVLQSSLNERLS
jgi:hypothetical protein